MKLVIRTTRKDSKNQVTNINYHQNSMSILKKNYNKINSHQIKLEQNKYNSLEKVWDLSSIEWVTGRKKRAKGAKIKKTFLNLKTINCKVVIIIGN